MCVCLYVCMYVCVCVCERALRQTPCCPSVRPPRYPRSQPTVPYNECMYSWLPRTRKYVDFHAERHTNARTQAHNKHHVYVPRRNGTMERTLSCQCHCRQCQCQRLQCLLQRHQAPPAATNQTYAVGLRHQQNYTNLRSLPTRPQCTDKRSK